MKDPRRALSALYVNALQNPLAADFIIRTLYSRRTSRLHRLMIEEMSGHRLHWTGRSSDAEEFDADITYIDLLAEEQPLNTDLLSLLRRTLSHLENLTIDFQTLSSNWHAARDTSTAAMVAFLRNVPELTRSGSQYQFLWSMCMSEGVERVLDLGTASGSSLSTFLTVPSVKQVTTVDVIPLTANTNWLCPDSHQYVQQRLNKESHRWNQVVVNILDIEILTDLGIDGSNIDLVYVDIGHDGIQEWHVAHILERALRPGTLVIWDDVYVSSMRNFWQALPWPKMTLGSLGHRTGSGLSVIP